MTKFRKLPVVVDAVQWNGKMQDVIDCHGIQFPAYGKPFSGALIISTLEGDHACELGDYIIKGIKGEFYPCKPDIFSLTYKEVMTTPNSQIDEALSLTPGLSLLDKVRAKEREEWISVDDRLPDENINVIGLINGEMFIVNHIDGDWADSLEFNLVDYPSHWMPLPASPIDAEIKVSDYDQ